MPGVTPRHLCGAVVQVRKIFYSILQASYFLANKKDKNIKPNKIAGNTNSAINHNTNQARSTKPAIAPIQRKTTSHVRKSFFDDCLFCCFWGTLGIGCDFWLMPLSIICCSAIRVVKGLSLDKVLKISSAEIPSFIHSTIFKHFSLTSGLMRYSRSNRSVLISQ